uniref:GRAM domain-containing protein n=1 Tax=Mandrillus leucophaeus TaxID=9568 RepID=A0A2K5Z3W2_MANLE
MAVNQSHTENRRGVLIPNGESLLKQSPNVELSFPRQSEGSNVFSGTKTGTLFLTSYRVIFITSRSINDPMLSFMMPFDLITNLTVEQPVFAANFIKGTIQAAPYGKCSLRNSNLAHVEIQTKAALLSARGFPLRTLNDWFSSMRIYVITGEGNICTPQMPCSVIAYGAPPAGYGAPPPGYGAPPAGYGAPVPVSYTHLDVYKRQGYGAPPPGYGAPPAGYGAQPAGNEGPPVGYRASPAGYGAPPLGYEAPPAGNEGLPAGYRASPAGSGARSHESAAAQAPENEASLPSASSS